MPDDLKALTVTQLTRRMFAQAGVTLSRGGRCGCGQIVEMGIGPRARAHFVTCPTVLSTIEVAQAELADVG
jgi:hypothetical protein